MHKITALPVLFALLAVFCLTFTAGCSDANAAESLYLPAHEPCPFAGLDDEEVDLSDWDQSYDPGQWGQSLEALGLDLDDDFDTQLWKSSDVEPTSKAAPFVGPTPQATPASNGGATTRIDINSASAAELTALPGIGPALAGRIVEYRQSRRFENAAQLQRVEGIGPATMKNIEPMIRVD